MIEGEFLKLRGIGFSVQAADGGEASGVRITVSASGIDGLG